MTQSTRIFGRRVRRGMGAIGLATLVAGLLPSAAHASSLGDLRAQASQIATRIDTLGNQADALSEKYDAAMIHAKALSASVARAKAEVAKAESSHQKAAKALQAEAVEAYVTNGDGGGSSTVQSADKGLLQAEYEQSVASKQADVEDRYKLASQTSATAEAGLKHAEAAVSRQAAQIKADKATIQKTISQLTSEESRAKGRIAHLVYEDRLAAQRAAAAAYQRRLAAERAATTTTTTVAPTPSTTVAHHHGSPTTAPPTTEAPTTTTTVPSKGGSSGGSGGSSGSGTPSGGGTIAQRAVAAALSRVGDPYVYGAAGPGSFDCSGLVMWSYAQAGVSLPHFSGAQYADTTHISMSDIEPGDLLFFADPDQHVAMYIGHGDIVQAPYPGADVQVIPLYSELVLASRVS